MTIVCSGKYYLKAHKHIFGNMLSIINWRKKCLH